MNKKYDIIYSIGRDCACASYLAKLNLRACSGPFDWLTNANFQQRFELMLNDFSNFLNKDDLHLMPKPTQFPADKNNDYYENIRTGLYFWHDFPADKSFEEAYPEVKQKYERRIKRFYENIQNHNKVLLVWFSQVHNTPNELVLDLCDKFCKKMGKTIDFLIIEHAEGLQQAEMTQLSTNILKYRCHATRFDENGVPQTQGNERLVSPIFSQYKLAIPFKLRLVKFLRRWLSKIICLFIFDKQLRKKIKKKLRHE